PSTCLRWPWSVRRSGSPLPPTPRRRSSATGTRAHDPPPGARHQRRRDRRGPVGRIHRHLHRRGPAGPLARQPGGCSMTAIRGEQTLHATPGDAVGWSWPFDDEATGEPHDFTGWTVEFLVRDPDSGDVIIDPSDAVYDPPAD